MRPSHLASQLFLMSIATRIHPTKQLIAVMLVALSLVGVSCAPNSDPTTDGNELAEFLRGTSDPTAIEALLATNYEERQTSIARCMKSEGHNYNPYSASGQFTSTHSDVAPGTRAFAETHGFGVVDRFLQPADEFVDANTRLFDEMTEPEIMRWQAYRDVCIERSYDEIEPVESAIERFGPDIAAVNERVSSDDRILAMARQWRECVSLAGFEVEDPAGLHVEIENQVQQLVSNQTEASPGDPANEIDERYGLSVDLVDALSAVREDEIALALVEFDCRVDFEDEYLQIVEGYIDDYLASL